MRRIRSTTNKPIVMSRLIYMRKRACAGMHRQIMPSARRCEQHGADQRRRTVPAATQCGHGGRHLGRRRPLRPHDAHCPHPSALHCSAHCRCSMHAMRCADIEDGVHRNGSLCRCMFVFSCRRQIAHQIRLDRPLQRHLMII